MHGRDVSRYKSSYKCNQDKNVNINWTVERFSSIKFPFDVSVDLNVGFGFPFPLFTVDVLSVSFSHAESFDRIFCLSWLTYEITQNGHFVFALLANEMTSRWQNTEITSIESVLKSQPFWHLCNGFKRKQPLNLSLKFPLYLSQCYILKPVKKP